MAIDPNPSIWNSDDSQEITAINYGTGDAGTYLLSEAGTEYHIWNDKGMVKGSSKMTCVRISARDDNGDEVKNITKQHWVEIKSLTIHAGSNGGDASGETDDNMTEFQPVGLNAPLAIGDIPADCYRKIMVRVKIPNSAIEGPVTFQIYVTYQEPSTSIAKWITGLHGNGVVYQPGGSFAVSIGSPASKLDIEKGLALIDNLEVYYGAAQQYDVSGLDDGTYKLYMTSVGVIGSTTGNIPSNSIELSRVVVGSGVATAVTDKRNFIMQRVISQHFQDLLAANTSGIHSAITGTGSEQNITTGITNPDYARNISITTTNVASPSGNVKIIGLVRGKNDEEEITIVPGSTAYGNKAFDTVTKIVIPAGVSSSDTVTVGFSDKIGLDNPIVLASDVFKKKVNNEDKTSELSGKVSATYNTVNCATITANDDMMLKYKSILTI